MKNFIPDLIAEKASENNHSGTFAASAMFIDISGFTSMTQSLMGHGKEGAEVLSNIINNIFTPSIKAIYDNGGFVSTFAGDAFTAIFETKEADYALKAAFEINKLFVDSGSVKTKFGEFELAVKIGLSHGEVEFGIIDAEVQKAYYFRGEAVDNCAKSEHHADKMQIVADGKFIEKLSVNVEKLSKQEHWFILTPKELELSPLEPVSKSQINDEIEAEFILNEILNMKDRGEFREIVSVFIGFEESDGYAESVKQVIKNTHAYGGYFNKIDFGDKGGVMLVIFGAPTGREKLYSRAADFALSLKQMRDLKFRTGISTGIAFCGIVGSDLRKEYTALGNVVNLSARLMMKAEPHETMTGPQIRSKLPAQYEFENKGLTEFKGFSDRIEIFSLRNKTALKQQLSYSGSFVGRKKEAEELRKLIQPIYEEKFGGIIYIDGPAGIGKSRFIDNFVKNLDNCASFYLPCDEVLRKSFNPFEYFFKNYFEQSEAVSKEENKALFSNKYAELVSQVKDEDIKSELIRTESVIGALIGLEWENSLYAQLDAKGKYENTLYAVKKFFLAQSLTKPAILVLEDGHWIDSDSLALVKTLIRNVEKYPFVILALCRPNDEGSVFDLLNPEKADISLNRLNIESFNKEMMNELLKDRFSSSIIPDKTSDFVWEKSNGNPFFVEQLVLYLTENNLLDNSLNLVSEASSIPSGISQIIIARIDRLSAEMKETVKTASVLGREFALRVLEKMLGLKITTDQTILEAGKNEQIWENLTEFKYIFKHALIRDAVYEVQLKETLRKLHDLAGIIIEDLYKNYLKPHFDELADHYDKAENAYKAVEYLEKAGDQAKESFQNEKALNVYKRLMLYLNHRKVSAKKVDIILKAAKIYKVTGKWDQAQEILENALLISKELEDPYIICRSMNQLGELMQNKSDPEKTRKIFAECLEIARANDDKTNMSIALNGLGNVLWRKGDYKNAKIYYEKDLEICKATGDEEEISDAYLSLADLYIVEGSYELSMKLYEKYLDFYTSKGSKQKMAVIMGNIGIVYYHLGDYEKALEYSYKKLEIKKMLGDLRGIALTLGNIASLQLMKNDYSEAELLYNKKLKIALELGDKQEQANVSGNLGIVYRRKGDYSKAMDFYNRQMLISEELGNKEGVGTALSNMGILYKYMGEFKKALENCKADLKFSLELGNKKSVCISYSTLGSVYFAKKEYPKALKYYDLAIKTGLELNILHIVCGFMAEKAKILNDTGDIENSFKTNAEAFEMAVQSNSSDTLLQTRITKYKIEKDEIKMNAILKTEKLENNIYADVLYELWKLTGKISYKSQALIEYKKLVEKTPNYEYGSRIEELKQDIL